MTFSYENRPGLTVNPPEIDEATGQPIGEAQVYDFEHKHPFFREEHQQYASSQETEEVEIDEDAFAPEDVEPSFDERLSDTFEEINTSEYSISPELANDIATADIGTSPEAITVKHLAASVYNGNLSPEEAFQAAVESGMDMDKLMFQYYQLKQHFN